jgi:GH15 family glucan-1,4-alpha-glucosidase
MDQDRRGRRGVWRLRAAPRSRHVDASLLLIPLVRFLRADDPRVRSTLVRVERDLTQDGLVYRYRTDDGLLGDGAFLICNFWLVDNLVMTGHVRRAHDEPARLLSYGNDLGFVSEQINPQTGELLGNFP